MRKQKIFCITFFLGFIFLVFRNWFLSPQIIGGDWPYFFDETLKNYSFFFSSWNPFGGNGLGGISLSYVLGIFHGTTVFLSQILHLPWPFAYKFFWFGLFIGLSIFSSTYLLNVVLPRIKFWQQIFASIIFTTNTYILMVVGGGQMGVALSYSIAPLVLARFIKTIDSGESFGKKTYLAIIAGLALAMQTVFDPRMTYITIIAITIYVILNLKRDIYNVLCLMFYAFIIPGIIVVLLHAAWIIPLMIARINPIGVLGDVYTGTGMVKFLSFGSFSQSFSLLHPNWPENIFGKTYFMKVEFILLPIIAYSSLLFRFKRKTLFFILLGIVGAFLAKGANPPFGGVYLWLFENIPGFIMFRDPTKFYLLVALSYSVLIPFSVYFFSGWLNSKYKTQKYSLIVLFIFFVCYWALLINPAILGKLGGTFRKSDTPKEYVDLKDFLYSEKEYFRTLWVPRQQRFSFISDIHPAIEAEPLFGTRSAEMLSKKISSEQGQSLLSELSVKYILIPYDFLGEQFLDDRKYSAEQRMEYETKLDTISWLKKIYSGKITVYKTPFKKDHFSLDKFGKISVKMINPMHYVLAVSIDQPQNLIFSENFSPYWILVRSQETVFSKRTNNGLNSFRLKQKGEYTVNVSFSLEKYYKFGRIISALTAIGLMICLIKLRRK